MAVKITDICISCGACIDECPVSAIVDDGDNPTGADTYYVYADKCVECVGYNDSPACAQACPTEGCIVWDAVSAGQPSRDDIGADMRKGNTPCVD
ncbi:MAG: 4Fe-4S dicluster domain-containing protein [Sulfurospirillaceae bacterium]|nr:4Fe-4S dicluster domain-containing protein [Sulfurospirillaceae bacterium]MDD3462144.1 4Fe-4S dicluster domain-containing protein [Sulfurospirillaceae bacterium]